jgi:hypothetical protein
MIEQQILPTRYHHGKPLPSIRGGMIAADAEELVADEPDVRLKTSNLEAIWRFEEWAEKKEPPQ